MNPISIIKNLYRNGIYSLKIKNWRIIFSQHFFILRFEKYLIKEFRNTYNLIIRKLRKKIIRGRRNYNIKKADVLLISYPKCGRTWLRLMIGKSIQLHFNLIENQSILELGKKISKNRKEIPNIVVFHNTYNIDFYLKRYENKKVIFLIRDPRDVLISNFYQRRFRKRSFTGTIQDFIHYDGLGSLNDLLEYYVNWGEYKKNIKEFLIIKYENLHKNAVKSLRKILKFINLSQIDTDTIEEAVRYSSFNNMRKIEGDRILDKKRLSPINSENHNTYKTRKGIIGDYKNHLDKNQITKINKIIKDRLEGYELYKDYVQD